MVEDKFKSFKEHGFRRDAQVRALNKFKWDAITISNLGSVDDYIERAKCGVSGFVYKDCLIIAAIRFGADSKLLAVLKSIALDKSNNDDFVLEHLYNIRQYCAMVLYCLNTEDSKRAFDEVMATFDFEEREFVFEMVKDKYWDIWTELLPKYFKKSK